MLEPGSLVAGKLRVERLLGQGGMGSVYVATHVGLDQQVAIKVLDPRLAHDPETVQRFVREARASARLRSDHVCRVSDVGALDDGVPYIEMELLAGEDLGQLIERGALAPQVAADYVLQACVAIAEAHALGIVHRDLKPANLFVTRRIDGSALVKVLDFGIATAPSAQDFKITRTAAVMGSPGYMSPEHLRSARDVDARSDIWSLGVILYEAVAGKLPFVAETITELAVKVVMDEPAPLVGVEPAYAAVVARCLAKDPAQRYPHVGELAAALVPLGGESAAASAMLVMRLSGASASMPIVRPPGGAGPGTGRGHPSTGPGARELGVRTTLASATGASQTMPPARRARRGTLVAMAVLVVGGGATAAIFASQRGSGDRRGRGVRAGRDASAAISAAPPDAGTAAKSGADASPGGVDEDQLLIGLGEMEADKNWPGIIRMAGVVASNATVEKYVANAKVAYRTEQLVALAAYARRHDCTSARTARDEAIKLLPDATADFTKAATCTAAAKPVVHEPDANALAATASTALEKGELTQALAVADASLGKDPDNLTALDVAARAACSTGDPAMVGRAYGYIVRLQPNDRTIAIQVCKDHGMKLPRPPAKPLDPGDVPKQLVALRAQLEAHDYAAAEKGALRLLEVEKLNREALRALGLAACALHHPKNVEQALARLPKRSPLVREIRSACEP